MFASGILLFKYDIENRYLIYDNGGVNMAIFSRQPNGLLCRFSTVVDAITDYNMTEEEFVVMYIQDAIEIARAEADRILKYHLQPFSEIENRRDFLGEMTEDEFDKIVKKMREPVKENIDGKIAKSNQA